MSEDRKLSKTRQGILDLVLQDLEKGVNPWQKTWRVFGAPHNHMTGIEYRGINKLALIFSGFEDPRWLTFNQAKKMGYSIKAGSKSRVIEVFKRVDKKTNKELTSEYILEQIKDLSEEEKVAWIQENVKTFLQTYNVFNASQITGIKEYAEQLADTDKAISLEERNEKIEKIISNSEADILLSQRVSQPRYNITEDMIYLPTRAAFNTIDDFYATALHEMAHSTGHESRLNRPFGRMFADDDKYAQEELVAEICSLFTLSDLMLQVETRENISSYIASWLKEIKANPNALFDAIREASKASDYLLAYAEKEETKQEEDVLEREITQEKNNHEVVIYWSENEYFATENIKLTVAEANKTLGLLDKYYHGLGYDKTKFGIYSSGEKIYEGRFDIGDGEKIGETHDLISHIRDFAKVSGYKDTVESIATSLELNAETYPMDKNATIALEEKIHDMYRERFDRCINNAKEDKYFDGINKEGGIDYESAIQRNTKYLEESKAAFVPEAEVEIILTKQEKKELAERQRIRNYYKKKKAKTLDLLEKNVPEEMKKLSQWCVWQNIKDKETGEVKKYIWNPNIELDEKGLGRKWARCNDPNSWASFEKALSWARENMGDGLAFVMRKENGITCIDLDDHIDKNGQYSEDLQTLLNITNTFSETSMSGRGAHIFFKGQVLDGRTQKKNDKNGWECYDCRKFISMTGNMLKNARWLGEINDNVVNYCRSKLNEGLLEKKKELDRKSAERSRELERQAAFTRSVSISEVIEKIESSKKGPEFKALMSGENLLNDHSRSDLKLMGILAFFTNCDKVQMQEIFERSGLHRPEKGQSYLDRTMNFAIANLESYPNENMYNDQSRKRTNVGAKDFGKTK